jgi:hypothetical protein
LAKRIAMTTFSAAEGAFLNGADVSVTPGWATRSRRLLDLAT